ncbi:hypothetical protein ACFV9E_00200 [Streptomyces sp. NPDC059835]|uniref:hypothetical protein n=1 Tax=Streptomyces sp. NPDC059835 TaxID=3346967 RepID=UPI0036499B0D
MATRNGRMPVLESTLSKRPSVFFYILYRSELISDEYRFGTAEQANAEVEALNVIEPGHTYIGVPDVLVACEGCEAPAGIFYDTGTNHLISFRWTLCPSHDYAGPYSDEY